jgi:predicted transcriptional regulator
LTDTTHPTHLGQIMRNVRLSLSYTRAKMAEILGVTERTIQNYESGHSKLTIENWARCILILERHVTSNKDKQILGKHDLPNQVAVIVKNLLQ